jgi:hypothetical protein
MALLWTFGRQHPNERRNCPCLQDTLTYVGLGESLLQYKLPCDRSPFPLRHIRSQYVALLPSATRSPAPSQRPITLTGGPSFLQRATQLPPQRDDPNATGLKPRQRVVTVSRLHSQLADYRIPSSLMPREPGGHGSDDDGLQPDGTR